ncbi:MAG: hypothetical protein ACRD1O_11870 [Terriglobia bacterium]
MLVSSAAASAGFAVTNACTNRVQPGAGCNVSVTFNPTTVGTATGTLTITDNAASSPQTISLTGTGQNFSLASAPTSPSSATVMPGQSATFSVALTSLGGFNQPVSLSCSGAPSEAACSVSPGSVTLSGSAPATVTVTVSTTAAAIAGPTSWLLPPAAGPHFLLAGLAGLSIFAGLLLGFRRKVWATSLRKLTWGIGLPVSLLAVLVMAGCGGGGGSGGGGGNTNPGTPAGTYSLTVTGTTGAGASAVTRNTSLTLVVR